MGSSSIFDSFDFTEEDLNEARMEYFSKTGDVPPVGITEEIAKLAMEIHINKFIESVQSKRKLEVSSELKKENIPSYEIPSVVPSTEKKYDSTFKLQIPKSPKKEKVENDIPIEVPVDEELEIDYSDLKNKSVGKLEIAKTVVKVIVDLALVAGVVISGMTINTKLKVHQGLKPTFKASEYDDYRWFGRNYETWYKLRDVGTRIADEAMEHLEGSELSINQMIALIMGEEVKQIIEEPGYYGDDSYYYFEGSLISKDQGWANGIYNGIYDNAKSKGIELPANLVDFLAANQLTNRKFNFNEIDGSLKTKELSELDDEEREKYSSYSGAMENLVELSRHLAYINALGSKGVGR